MYPSALLNKGLVSLALTTILGLVTAAPLGGPLGVNLDLGALGTVKVGPLRRDTGEPNTLEKSSLLGLDLEPVLPVKAGILKRSSSSSSSSSSSNPTLEKSSLLDLNLKPILPVQVDILERSGSSNPTLEKSSLLGLDLKPVLPVEVDILERSEPTN